MSVAESLSRHTEIFKIHLISVVQFRLRALVWFILGLVNTLVILLFWWATLRANGSSDAVATLPSVTTYYLLMLTFGSVIMCHIEEDISYRDIQKGDLYGYLLRPYSYILKKFHEEVVWRLLSGSWALILLVVLSIAGVQLGITVTPFTILFTAIAVVLGLLCSFFIKVSLGLISIWITNLRGLVDLYTILEIIFAGFVIPLSLFPESFRSLALHSPLAVQVYFPVQIISGNLDSVEMLRLFVFQILWILVFFLVSRQLFHSGVRHYTGVSQ